MKKAVLLLWMAQATFVIVKAQAVHYGLWTGTSGANASYFGKGAGFSVNGANSNSFFGYFSGANTTTGDFNCAFGAQALYKNDEGNTLTAIGFESMYSFTSNSGGNTAVGYRTLRENRSGTGNTVVGSLALQFDKMGWDNTAIGIAAMTQSDSSRYNTALGAYALNRQTLAYGNTAIGSHSLYSNTVGTYNTAVGINTLYDIGKGHSNTAVGSDAMQHFFSGNRNTGVGARALSAIKNGSNNSAFGYEAGPVGDVNNTTSLGYLAKALASNQVVIGNTNVVSIGGQVSWSTFSDGRFKQNIREDVSGLDFINKLRPVTYEVDKKSIQAFLKIADSDMDAAEKNASQRQTGFIAQEVEAIVKKTGYVFNGVDAPQNDNSHYSIRYAEFVVPLVKAVQELTTKFNEREEKLKAQELEIARLKEKLSRYEGNSEIKTGTGAVLFQHNSNLFSADIEIKMTLPETTQTASVIISDLEGKQLKNIPVTGRGPASVKIAGNDLSAGFYLYTLMVDGNIVDTKRLVLTK